MVESGLSEINLKYLGKYKHSALFCAIRYTTWLIGVDVMKTFSTSLSVRQNEPQC